VVRVADAGDRRGLRVHVSFRDASSGVPAVARRKESRGGGEAPGV
jgi:hypothetical protein